MQLEDVKIVFGKKQFPLSSQNIPELIEEEIKQFIDKMETLLDDISIPGFIKGKSIELRVKVKL